MGGSFCGFFCGLVAFWCGVERVGLVRAVLFPMFFCGILCSFTPLLIKLPCASGSERFSVSKLVYPSPHAGLLLLCLYLGCGPKDCVSISFTQRRLFAFFPALSAATRDVRSGWGVMVLFPMCCNLLWLV